MSCRFLETPARSVLGQTLERESSRILTEFWEAVFSYQHGGSLPSLEDHFTVLDLAANSGHQLGKKYPPSKLRAIRRISIHRVFQILDSEYRPSDAALRFVQRTCDAFDVSIVSLNWDIVAERLLRERGVQYGINIGKLEDSFEKPAGISLLKVHGSSNWVYCDSCRRLYAGAEKSALLRKAFLKRRDFRLFEVDKETINSGLPSHRDRKCPNCRSTLGGRLATFSYRKAFSINQFQTIWERAHAVLSDADKWLFIGYSMPAADFEFKHLLKSAQLGRRDPRAWNCESIVMDDKAAADRYRAFFGNKLVAVHQQGLAAWVDNGLDAFIGQHATGST